MNPSTVSTINDVILVVNGIDQWTNNYISTTVSNMANDVAKSIDVNIDFGIDVTADFGIDMTGITPFTQAAESGAKLAGDVVDNVTSISNAYNGVMQHSFCKIDSIGSKS